MPEAEPREQVESPAASDSTAIELWRRWLDGGRKAREVSDMERARAFKYVKGGDAQWERFGKESWGGTRVTANYLYPTLKVLLPHLIPRHPRGLFMPSAAARLDLKGAILALEEKVAYDWREGHYLRHIARAVNEAVIGGIGWVRTSWDKERQIPEVRHVKPTRMLVDPEAEEDLSDAGWVAERVTMRVADLKADPFFENAARLKPETFGSSYDEGKKEGEGTALTLYQKEQLATVKVWYIWSRRGEGKPNAPADHDQEEALGDNVLLCYAEGHDFWLHKGPWPLQFDHDEFPYRCLRFNYDPDRFLSYGPMQPALAIQEFLNWQVSFLVQHTKKGAVCKIVYDKNAINTDQLSRIFNGVDYEGVAVDFLDGGKTPFHIVEFQTDPTKIENTIQIAKQMLFDITGAAELIMGGQGKTQSATEADIRERRAQNRIDDMSDQVKDFLIDVNRAVAMIEVLKTPAESKNGTNGIDFFLGNEAIAPWEVIEKLTPEAMRAEVLFDIDAGTMRRPTREQQLQDLFGLWDRLAPNYLQLGMFDAVLVLIARMVKALELPDPQELVPAQMGPAAPPPEQVAAEQQAQQMQMQQAQQAQQAQMQQEQVHQQAMSGMQQGLQQIAQQAGAAIQQLQSEVASVRSEGQQALQAAFQGFQAALAGMPKPSGITMQTQGPVALTSEQTDLTANQVEAQVGQFTAQTQSVNIGADVVNVPPPVAEPVPTITEQVVERDALGRIARIVARSEPAQPIGPVGT